MRYSQRKSLALATVGLCLALGGASSARKDDPPNLAQADRLYAEKSFGRALAGYEAAMKVGAVPAVRRDEVQLRIAECLGKTEKWDRAFEASLEFVKDHRGSVWEPRGLYWMGQLYLKAPRFGYRVGRKRFRGSSVPQGDGGEARSRFADTAFWTPAVVSGIDGTADVEFEWPENLTEWRAKTIGCTAQAVVGTAEARVTTRKDLLVRLQTPRFSVERDEITLSGNVHNYQAKDARVRVKLELQGGTAELASSPAEMTLDVPSNGERRADFRVKILHEGSLTVRITAQSSGASDGMEVAFPVVVHGVERMFAQGGTLRDSGDVKVNVDFPEARKPGSSELRVQLDPSLASVLLDALPYLAQYPYGCIEQTVSRFAPAVMVARTLKDAGYDLDALRERATLLERREREGGSRAVENSPYTYPEGAPGIVRSPVRRGFRNPVFDRFLLDDMVGEGIRRIVRWQKPDGGWGWWPSDASDPYMTAYVVQNLIVAREAGREVDRNMLHKALTFLARRLQEEDDPRRAAWIANAVSMDSEFTSTAKPIATGKLYQNRERLDAYGKALLAMALARCGDKDKAEVVLRNLEGAARVDEANGTASWGESSGEWWRWWNNRVEINAAALQAFVLIDPRHRLAPMVANWLSNNRHGSAWGSTKETALAILALTEYARANNELSPDYTLTVDFGGRIRRAYHVTRENALLFDNRFIVPDELLRTGKQTLSIAKSGHGMLYFSAYTRYFSREEPIPAAGNEISVRRKYFRLVPNTARGRSASDLPQTEPGERPNPFLTGRYELLDLDDASIWVDTSNGPAYDRVPIADGAEITSGDLLEVELQIESKNDYEYVVFEDLKPAGCEPAEVRSGGHDRLGLYSDMELRDQKVAFFLSSLPQGRRTLAYSWPTDRMYAEIPGRFHVPPTNGYAMYAPEVRTVSDEMRIGVIDR